MLLTKNFLFVILKKNVNNKIRRSTHLIVDEDAKYLFRLLKKSYEPFKIPPFIYIANVSMKWGVRRM